MTSNRFYFITLMLLLTLLGVLNYQLIQPFFSPIAWAVVLSIVFYPIYALIARFVKWKTPASLLTVIIIILIILGPFAYVSMQLFGELKGLASGVHIDQAGAVKGILGHPSVKPLADKILVLFNISEDQLDTRVTEYISGMGKDLLARFTEGMGNIAVVMLNFVLMIFSIFFLLKDGAGFLVRIRDYMPFSDDHKRRLETQVRDIIVSTIYGGVIVAIIQGIIGGIAFAFLGITAPVLWGFAISVASFIPFLGAFAVWGPVAGYLFFQGAVIKGITLTVVGVFGISLIDNILKPMIIGSRTKMHLLVIFFSVLGGIKLFGLIGLIMGPLVVAVFISLIEIFRNIEDGQEA